MKRVMIPEYTVVMGVSMVAKWIERFRGHYYLDVLAPGYDVHCRPHADGGWASLVDTETGRSLFFDRCGTLGEAQENAALAYKLILIAALHEVG